MRRLGSRRLKHQPQMGFLACNRTWLCQVLCAAFDRPLETFGSEAIHSARSVAWNMSPEHKARPRPPQVAWNQWGHREAGDSDLEGCQHRTVARISPGSVLNRLGFPNHVGCDSLRLEWRLGSDVARARSLACLRAMSAY